MIGQSYFPPMASIGVASLNRPRSLGGSTWARNLSTKALASIALDLPKIYISGLRLWYLSTPISFDYLYLDWIFRRSNSADVNPTDRS